MLDVFVGFVGWDGGWDLGEDVALVEFALGDVDVGNTRL